MTSILLSGFFLGALAVLPFGPMGVVCLHRIISHGARAGVTSGSAIALAAALWCLAAALGLSWLAAYLPMNAALCRALFGAVLVIVAFKNLCRRPPAGKTTADSAALAGHFMIALMASLPNPLTLATVAALLTAFGFGQQRLSFAMAGGLSLAVFIGGVCLWLALAALLTRLQTRLGPEAATRFTRSFNWTALGLGLAYLASVFF